MKLIVSDTGPILHLSEANLLELLQNAGEVHIPQMVDSEMVELHPAWINHKPPWMVINPLSSNELKGAESLYLAGFMDLGEAEAIMLTKRLKPDWFLTDDVDKDICKFPWY